MIKAKKYNIADSNIANLGTELERKVKKAAADGEPAWNNVGNTEMIKVWRIEKFKVVAWPGAFSFTCFALIQFSTIV